MSTCLLKADPSLTFRFMWMATLGMRSRSRSRFTSWAATAPSSRRTRARPATDRGRSSQVEQIMPP